MTQQTYSAIPRHTRVTFEFPSSVWASKIYVTGDFNQWSKTATPLRQERDGVWRVTIELPANQTYEYHFLVDGMPQNIYQADQSTTGHRSFNSILQTRLTIRLSKQQVEEMDTNSRYLSVG